MSYTPLLSSHGQNNPVLVASEFMWKTLQINIDNKPCVTIKFLVDFFERWMILSGKNWLDVCQLLVHYVGGPVDRSRAIHIIWSQRDVRSRFALSPLNINYAVLEPVNRLLYDFKEAESAGNRRKLYQLVGAWRDMALLPLSNPKGPINKQKFYLYTRDVRLSVHALLCVLWRVRPGRDMKNMIISLITIK